MTTEKTLTEDELTRVKELNRRLYDSLLAIGDMETSIVTLTERKNVALTEHKKTVA